MKDQSKVFGRGRASAFTFTDDTVTKTVLAEEAWQPAFMLLHPDVFINVSDVRSRGTLVEYDMPRLVQCELPELLLDASQLLPKLWERRTVGYGGWRLHLRLRLENIVGVVAAAELVSALPSVTHHVSIHGDPTMANLLLYSQGERRFAWIDPLLRQFIPGDPHVDLGKLFQSCWGYERCLASRKEQPRFDRGLARELAWGLNLDYDLGWHWCKVHTARLLPYQDGRMHQLFQEVLRCMCST